MSWQVYPTPVRRVRFSPTELRHILLALVVLTFAFGLAFSGGIRGPLRVDVFLGSLLLAAIAVPTGFLLHELGHKFVAQRYGCRAEFRSWTYGLLIALFTSFLGFLFAAPGAVVIQGYVGPRENGRISAAGPGVNLGIGGTFFAAWFVLQAVGFDPVLIGFMTLQILALGVAFINLLLGAFNMIPVPPLDGSKVLRWDLRVYLPLLAALVGLAIPAAILFFT